MDMLFHRRIAKSFGLKIKPTGQKKVQCRQKYSNHSKDILCY